VRIPDHLDDVMKDFYRRLQRVDEDDPVCVMIEHRFGFLLVEVEAHINNCFARIIEAIIFQGAFAQSAHELFPLCALEMEDLFNIDQPVHQPCLIFISRNAVQNQSIDIGFELAPYDLVLDTRPPKLDGEIIGHQ